MDNKARKIRKTRPQKKALVVGIISTSLTLIFGVGVLISALNYPTTTSLDNEFEDSILQGVNKLDNNDYYLACTHRDENDVLDDTILYFYNSNHELISKTKVFSEAEEKYGIDAFSSFNGCFTVEEADSLYVASGNYLFHYKGLSSRQLNLVGYTDSLAGRINRVAGNDKDLYVLSQVGTQYRLDRFDINDDSLTIKTSGYIYQASEGRKSDNNYELSCPKEMFIYSFDAIGDYCYLSTGVNIIRIHRDMLNNNYRILYENKLKELTALYPDKSNDELQKMAKDECIVEYGWVDYYNDHTLELNKSLLDPINYSFYSLPDMNGVMRYKNNYYFADIYDNFYKYTVEQLEDDARIINYLDGELTLLDNVDLGVGTLKNMAVSSLNYDQYGTYATIFHVKESPLISIFDLEEEKIIYTIRITTSISRVVFNQENGTLIYQYQDPVNKKSGVNYISTCEVHKMLTVSFIKPLLIVSIILTFIALITALICWLSYIFKAAMTFVIKTGKGLKKSWPIYIILFPSILLLSLFCYYPGVAAIFTSFYDYKGTNGVKIWNNFANYAEIFTNTASLSHFGNMVLFLLADVALSIIPPLIFAFFLTLMKSKKLSGILRTLLFIPGIIPGIASLLIWKIGIYGDYGVVNTIIKASGGEPIIFFDPKDYTNVMWLLLMGFPFIGSYLIFYGAMMNIPSSYYEAAELDGITIWKRFFKIDLPLCFPQIKYILIMTIIHSIQNFSRIYITMGRTENVISTPIVEMYILMNDRNYGLASAYATVLFVILFGLTYLSMRNRIKQK